MASYLKKLSAPVQRRKARAMPQRGPNGLFVKASKKVVKAPRKAARVGAGLSLLEMPLAREARRSMHVTTLLFKKSAGWTEASAKAWAKRHGYKHGSVDVAGLAGRGGEGAFIRIRQESPGKAKTKRTVQFGKGIQAVVGREQTAKGIVMARKRSSRVPAHKPFPIPKRRRAKKHKHWGRVKGHTRRTYEPKAVAAAPRRRRRRRARAYAAAPVRARARTRTVTRYVQAPRRRRRRHHSREAAVVQARRHHRRRHRYARSNPMFGGEFALAVISGGLGFVLADVADRYFATYDPSAQGAAPTNKFTSPTGTLANTLNIASPPGIVRIGVGVGMTILPALGSAVVRNSMARSALQGMTIGAGVRLFASLFNSYVMANLLKSSAEKNVTTSIGARLYPAEITAALNSAPAGQTPLPGLGARAGTLGQPNVAAMTSQAYGAYGQPIGPGTGGYGSEPGPGSVSPPGNAAPPIGNMPPVGVPSIPQAPMPSGGGAGNGYLPGSGVPSGGSGGGCTNCGCQTGDCGCLATKPMLGDKFAYIGIGNG